MVLDSISSESSSWDDYLVPGSERNLANFTCGVDAEHVLFMTMKGGCMYHEAALVNSELREHFLDLSQGFLPGFVDDVTSTTRPQRAPVSIPPLERHLRQPSRVTEGQESGDEETDDSDVDSGHGSGIDAETTDDDSELRPPEDVEELNQENRESSTGIVPAVVGLSGAAMSRETRQRVYVEGVNTATTVENSLDIDSVACLMTSEEAIDVLSSYGFQLDVQPVFGTLLSRCRIRTDQGQKLTVAFKHVKLGTFCAFGVELIVFVYATQDDSELFDTNLMSDVVETCAGLAKRPVPYHSVRPVLLALEQNLDERGIRIAYHVLGVGLKDETRSFTVADFLLRYYEIDDTLSGKTYMDVCLTLTTPPGTAPFLRRQDDPHVFGGIPYRPFGLQELFSPNGACSEYLYAYVNFYNRVTGLYAGPAYGGAMMVSALRAAYRLPPHESVLGIPATKRITKCVQDWLSRLKVRQQFSLRVSLCR